MTLFITSAISSIVNGALTVSRTLLSLGYSARDRVVNATLDAMELREIERKRLRRENVPENQPNAILLQEQSRAKKYQIENTHIKNVERLKDYVMPITREKTLENIRTKLNVIVKITLIHSSNRDEFGNPVKKPHHLEHKGNIIFIVLLYNYNRKWVETF